MILSVFPSLFSYTLLGIFVLRLALGLVILRLAFTTLFKINRPESWIKGTGIVLLLVSILLVIGLYTQIAALLVASRARVRAGAVRAHFQHAKRINMCNRAAACDDPAAEAEQAIGREQCWQHENAGADHTADGQ